MNHFLNDINEKFAKAKGFENKYMLLLKLARTGEFLDQTQCIDANEVAGCEAKVWLKATQSNGKLKFEINSDSRLIKAIVWIIVSIANESDQDSKIDYVSILIELGLGNVVSQSRQNGMTKIQHKIEQLLSL